MRLFKIAEKSKKTCRTKPWKIKDKKIYKTHNGLARPLTHKVNSRHLRQWYIDLLFVLWQVVPK